MSRYSPDESGAWVGSLFQQYFFVKISLASDGCTGGSKADAHVGDTMVYQRRTCAGSGVHDAVRQQAAQHLPRVSNPAPRQWYVSCKKQGESKHSAILGRAQRKKEIAIATLKEQHGGAQRLKYTERKSGVRWQSTAHQPNL